MQDEKSLRTFYEIYVASRNAAVIATTIKPLIGILRNFSLHQKKPVPEHLTQIFFWVKKLIPATHNAQGMLRKRMFEKGNENATKIICASFWGIWSEALKLPVLIYLSRFLNVCKKWCFLMTKWRSEFLAFVRRHNAILGQREHRGRRNSINQW